jgi:LPXTG-motif cell wall-anchored protein
MPPRVVTEKEVSATLARAESGAASPPAKAHAAPAPSSAAMEPAAEGKHLPKTASPLPLVGLVGLTALLAGAGLTLRRRLAR